MNKHTADAMTTAALRDLDPAPSTVLTVEEVERADATFARILATSDLDQTPAQPALPRRRWKRLMVPVGLVGAAGAVPLLLFGGGSVFATWTPTPETLTGGSADEARIACFAALQAPDQGEKVMIAERRGEWTYVLFAGPTSEGTCFMPEGLVGQENPAAQTREGFMGRYAYDAPEAPTPARDRIIETGSGATSVPTHGLWGFSDGEEWLSAVEGFVGSDVTGITVHTPIDIDVEASVANGRFAAWWPSAVPSSENLEVMGAWTYTVTLADGSTRPATG